MNALLVNPRRERPATGSRKAPAPVWEDLMRHRAGILRTIQATALLAATAAQAVTLTTPPLHPDAGGRLACTVVNVGQRALGITAHIIGESGQDVTDFVATEWSSESADVLASVDAESSADDARYCKVVVTGGGRSQVRAALEAFDATGARTAIVEAR
jgi:hypothetical protein